MKQWVKKAFGETDVGNVRTNNEDSFIVNPASNCFVVCDGMGGHQDGEVASKLVAESLSSKIMPASSDILRSIDKAVKEGARAIHDYVIEKRYRGMGTTVSLLCLPQDIPLEFILNIGDSRIYGINRVNGSNIRLEKLTADDTLAEQYVREGTLTPEEAEESYYRHVLTRSIFSDGHKLQIGDEAVCEDGTECFDIAKALQIRKIPKERAGYLLCSDGLTDAVSDSDIERIINANIDNPERIPSLLIQAALNPPLNSQKMQRWLEWCPQELAYKKLAGKDNITAVYVEVDGNAVEDCYGYLLDKNIPKIYPITGSQEINRFSLDSGTMEWMSISRRHGEIIVRDGKVFYRDFGSHCGTALVRCPDPFEFMCRFEKAYTEHRKKYPNREKPLEFRYLDTDTLIELDSTPVELRKGDIIYLARAIPLLYRI